MAAESKSAVRTSFTVKRWDADQTRWAAGKLGRDLKASSVTVHPREFAALQVKPYSVTVDEDCNLVVQSGWVALLGSIAGTSITTKYSASAARIGVGTSTTAAAYGDTKLGGDTGGSSTTSYYQLVSGAPTISTASSPPTLAFSASFGTGVANFAWNEFAVDNGASSSVTTSGNVVLDHGISSQGTKTSGQTWTATVTLSFGYPSGSGTVS